jgi:hypothetical protein
MVQCYRVHESEITLPGDGKHFASTDVANRRSFAPESPLTFHYTPASKRWKILHQISTSEGELCLSVNLFVF